MLRWKTRETVATIDRKTVRVNDQLCQKIYCFFPEYINGYNVSFLYSLCEPLFSNVRCVYTVWQ